MARDERTEKEEVQRESPQSVVEWAAAGALAKIVKMGYDEYKDSKARALNKVDPTDPLFHIVYDVVPLKDGSYSVLLNCENLGVHGVYIEQVKLVEPFEETLQTDSACGHRGDSSAISSGGMFTSRDADPLPTHLPGGRSLWVEANVPRWPNEEQYGKLKVTYTVLGIAKSEKPDDVEFTVPSQERS